MGRLGRDLASLEEDAPSLRAIASVLPASLVEETLNAAGKAAKRNRKLPPRVVAWLCIAMGFFRGQSTRGVLSQLADSLNGHLRWGPAEAPCATSTAKARDRLGWEVVEALFRRATAYLVGKYANAGMWCDLVLAAIDGTCALAPDTPANEAEFGRPATSRGGAKSAFPMLRLVVIVNVFTHLIHQAVVGPYSQGELTLAATLVGELAPGTLLLMDAAYQSYKWFAAVLARDSHFLCRAKTGKGAPKLERIAGQGSDTDYPVRLRPWRGLKRKQPDLPEEIVVRVIVFWARRRNGELRKIVLLTSLLSEKDYPAKKIAALYLERWESELVLRELKCELGEDRVFLRSKTPSRVRQEVWGLLIAYNCIRALMAEAAALKGVQPRRLSFVESCRLVRRALEQLPGRDTADLEEWLLLRLSLCVLPKRRVGRNCPRAVKLKFSKYPRKRPRAKAPAGST